MADQLMLSDDYSDMYSAWTKGGTYRVELTITQTSDPGKPFVATVNEVTDYGDVEMEEERVPRAKPSKPVKPNAKEAKAAY